MIKAHCKGIQEYTVYPGGAGIFKYDMIIYEDSRTSPKSSEDELAPSAFNLKNQRSRGRYCHFINIK